MPASRPQKDAAQTYPRTYPGSTSLAVRPLILTLAFDEESQQRFERDRQRYYPAHLNRIPAHLSLFHALPGEELAAITGILQQEAARLPFAVQISGLMRLGRGVAYAVDSPALDALHVCLRARWLPWLSRQDQQPFRPHVVVQNKVEPAVARGLFDELSSGFQSFTATASSLRLWHYDGGPWSEAGVFGAGVAGASAVSAQKFNRESEA